MGPLQSKNYNYNGTSTPQNLQEGSPPRTLPLQTFNYNYAIALQKVPQEGSPPRTLPLQTYNYNYNYNYAIALQKVPQEGGPPRTLPSIRLRIPTQGPSLQTYSNPFR